MKKINPEGDRKRHLSVYCTKREYETICVRFHETTSRSFSAYARKMLLAEPMVKTYRNLSIDSLITSINGLRAELERLIEHQALSIADKIRMSSIIAEIKDLFIKLSMQCIPE